MEVFFLFAYQQKVNEKKKFCCGEGKVVKMFNDISSSFEILLKFNDIELMFNDLRQTLQLILMVRKA